MSSKYLNDTGLDYFWGKIKAWCNATFAAITHNQASNTITAMTGYSRPSSTSAISTSDTLNQAIGKLEKSIDDADISNVVHRTGAESIAGVKTFTDILHATNSDADSSAIRIHCDALDVASLPSSDKYANIHFLDVNGIQLGRLLLYKNANGQTGMTIAVKQHNSSSGQDDYDATLGVRITANGSGLAYCPTPTSDSNTIAIATTEWVRTFGDSTYVHLTGNETISGRKTFNNHIHLTGGSSSNTIFSDNTSGALYLTVNSISDGANLILHGSSYGSTEGWFYLEARKGTTKRQLNASPSGNLYWNGAAVQTSSDERLKTSLTSVPDDILDSWEEVEWGAFKYLDAVEEKGDSARYHIGLIAQSVDRIFDKNNVNIRKYGILCYEKRDAVKHNIIVTDREAFTDENGVYHPAVTHDEGRVDDPVDLWMIRYTEALCMEAAYQRRENARLKKRVADLEERLAALEMKLS